MLSTTSTSRSASSSIVADLVPSALGLVRVRLCGDARLGIFGLGVAVDAPVPEDRAAETLLVLERRLLGLQLLDERSDVRLVGLPEQRHGGGAAKLEV